MNELLWAPSKMADFSHQMMSLPACSGTRFSAAARAELNSLPQGIGISQLLRTFEKLEDGAWSFRSNVLA